MIKNVYDRGLGHNFFTDPPANTDHPPTTPQQLQINPLKKAAYSLMRRLIPIPQSQTVKMKTKRRKAGKHLILLLFKAKKKKKQIIGLNPLKLHLGF